MYWNCFRILTRTNKEERQKRERTLGRSRFAAAIQLNENADTRKNFQQEVHSISFRDISAKAAI